MACLCESTALRKRLQTASNIAAPLAPRSRFTCSERAFAKISAVARDYGTSQAYAASNGLFGWCSPPPKWLAHCSISAAPNEESSASWPANGDRVWEHDIS